MHDVKVERVGSFAFSAITAKRWRRERVRGKNGRLLGESLLLEFNVRCQSVLAMSPFPFRFVPSIDANGNSLGAICDSFVLTSRTRRLCAPRTACHPRPDHVVMAKSGSRLKGSDVSSEPTCSTTFRSTLECSPPVAKT